MFARLLLLFLFVAAPQPAGAQVAVADSGDTGWMMLCGLLVLLAALPGLALRHMGLVNVRNGLAIAAQTAAVAAGASLVWGIAGYSLAYAPGSSWLGGGANMLLANLNPLQEGMTVPESAFVLFQMSLAVFAACLLPGAVAGRARLGWMAALAPLWLLIVYAPVAHWIWGGGWLAGLGVMDFAGALVVHVSAGFSGLALMLMIGRRRSSPDAGHAPLLSIAGGALIWMGWTGALGGWALGATGDAAAAILNAHFAACSGALCWMLIDRLAGGKPSATGPLSGALTGLAAISASGALAGTGGAILTGIVAVLVCRAGKAAFAKRIDDGCDVFVIHGLGGLTGVMLMPVMVLPVMGGAGFEPGISLTGALASQAAGVGVVVLWSMAGSAIAALILSVLLPMRGTAQEEADGLDSVQHGQQAWDFR
ncbi:ammonium transporter [Sphingobium sp. DC-2]|uniref:ammonium transporter n=1 Tax=Sphingobium sp. DC-2 TaxID=1303256 RepID=UPI00056BDCCB|nr:ammonium transporter [Sphingobium sp. DC-2]